MDSYAVGKASRVGLGDSPGGEENLPTAKQIGFTEKLGIKIPDGITRKNLSELIDIAKKSKESKMGDG
jgi:hypothetical protein